MRAAIIGDSHYDQQKRFEETKRLHAWIRQDAERRGCTLTLHTGDLFERKSTPLERQAAFDWLRDMADLGEVVLVRGNHDAVDDLPLAEKLDTRNPITVVEQSAVVEVQGALIACMAWPRKSELLAASGADSREAAEALAVQALQDVLRGLGAELRDHDGPTALIMHAMVRESRTSTGQPLVGCDFEIGLDDLALVGADAYFLGHIHLHQAWEIGDAPVIYPGDPRRTSFGELEAKGYVVAEWDDAGVFVGWQFVEVPATPMIAIEGEYFASGVGSLEFNGMGEAAMNGVDVRGAEVRVRYVVDHDQRIAAAAEAEAYKQSLLRAGAVLVQVEERVRPQERTRAEAIPTRATRAEQLDAYWKAKSFEPGERRLALVAKLARIEERRHAA